MDSSTVGSLLVRSRPTTMVVTPTPTEIVPYKIPSGIVDYVLANHYTGEGHPGEHLLYLSQLCSLFKLEGVTMEFFMKKLFSVSLKDKASDWYKLLDNSDSLEWPELMSLFYAIFYPLRGIHQDRNYIYNFWSRDGESIAQAWGRLKSLMLKCPNHEFPRKLYLQIFMPGFLVRTGRCWMPPLAWYSKQEVLKKDAILLKGSRRTQKTGKLIKVLNPL